MSDLNEKLLAAVLAHEETEFSLPTSVAAIDISSKKYHFPFPLSHHEFLLQGKGGVKSDMPFASVNLRNITGREITGAGLGDSEVMVTIKILNNLSNRLLNHLYLTADANQQRIIEGDDKQKKREDELVIEIAERDEGGLSWSECSVEFLTLYPGSTTNNPDAFRKRYRGLRGGDYIRRKSKGGRPSGKASK